MERAEIQKLIEMSLEEFFKNEQDLIDIDANERSISFKIASIIQKQVPSVWNVDCEYNRDGNDTKLLGIPIENTKTDDTKGRTVYPDIIIHKRRKKENLLIIEIKKSGIDYEKDLKKIKAFLSSDKYSYKFGLMLIINTEKESKEKYETCWFPST